MTDTRMFSTNIYLNIEYHVAATRNISRSQPPRTLWSPSRSHPSRHRVSGSLAQVCRSAGEKAGQRQGKTHWGRRVAGDQSPLPEAVHRPHEGQSSPPQQQGALWSGWRRSKLECDDTKVYHYLLFKAHEIDHLRAFK